MKDVKFNSKDAALVIDEVIKANPSLANERGRMFEDARETWEVSMAAAKTMVLALIDELSPLGNDMGARQAVRDRISEDPEFIALSSHIAELLDDGSVVWVYALLRATARRCQRRHSEEIKSRYAEMVAAELARKEADDALCRATPNYGLF